MSISAQMVKELRTRTGAGMMECKKALVECDGDIEVAIEHMRKTGLAKADKKADRTAAEGVICIVQNEQTAMMLEVNCETDFVSGGDDFNAFVSEVSQAALDNNIADTEALAEAKLASGETVEHTRRELIAKIGENISVRRLINMPLNGQAVGAYLHGKRIGTLVLLEGGDESVAKDIAMHVAASQPAYLDESKVPADVVAKEREIQLEQAKDLGKPPEILEKIIDGKLQKWLSEITLVGQAFVKDPDLSISKVLTQANASVVAYERFEVGEGIEKATEDFAAEVMAQVKGVA